MPRKTPIAARLWKIIMQQLTTIHCERESEQLYYYTHKFIFKTAVRQ